MTEIKTVNCDISIRIGGEAGQGMKVISSLLGKVFIRKGLWVFINQDIMSRIRGGHNFTQIRVSDKQVNALSSNVDILVCLDKNTLDMYKNEIEGIIIYDSGKVKENIPSGNKFLPIPLEKMAKEIGKNSKMANTIASGAILALLGLSPDVLFELLDEIFARKGSEVIEANKNCARAGYDYVKENYKGDILCKINIDSGNAGKMKKMIVTGCESIALGAIASDIRFYSGYPMSPSTPIMEYLASKQKEYGLIVEQSEDEISAINMVLGAYFCGARSMTATSGGGLALMVEGISLAGMTETPAVIVDGQRPAPATGFPTRTEQGDLLFVAHAGHGEFPRVILAPSTAEEAFYLTNKAFYLAEKFQIPVFILVDQYLNESSWTVEKFNMENIHSNFSGIISPDILEKIPQYAYRRYEITDTGVSPRIIPGTAGQVVYADSDEHTVEGHITESAGIRRAMVEKRLRKSSGILEEMSMPKVYPDEKAEVYLVSWGSNFGIVEEAVSLLRQKGISIGYIHFSEVYPLKKDIIPSEILENAGLIGVENNATGQFAKLLKMETGISIKDKILKYDGRPFSPQELVNRTEQILR
ncbi:MAG: hypothetical protein AUJ85_08435 [Elusimicrobia bacterium CG1_02_37_114]|nr:MAG: hypothetical protein AUJ85_08435 [Elusimicrobia bacterium CG1_02_37_114]PIV53976.1 MAG: 2-oxoacid:acceptor oxidoreductase subunit alpha [Elusimicrobia bacterium CG02_land_8_20_14_3_00_37_13]PIZ13008.1 MAG: 2-oxoacid:acceptor oxidoreductase subunit alpha [Elusimicrobia bacterium CG_4_10_14_0_8_um_filter_37_32]